MSDIIPDLSIFSGNKFLLRLIGVFELVTFQLPLGDCRAIGVFELVTFQLPLGDCNKDSLISFTLVGVINILSSRSLLYSSEIIWAVKIIIFIIGY